MPFLEAQDSSWAGFGEEGADGRNRIIQPLSVDDRQIPSDEGEVIQCHLDRGGVNAAVIVRGDHNNGLVIQ
eukprot:scaffold6814_cov49-Cyclotella_meneghiniana.AAC.3